MRSLLRAPTLGSVVLVLVGVASGADAVTVPDPRFFGTYCSAESQSLCDEVTVEFLGIPVDTRRECIEVESVRARLRHFDTGSGGLLTASGSAVVRGDDFRFVGSGHVRRRGTARLSTAIARLGRARHWAYLSEDGLALRLEAMENTLTLHKDACGNEPPVVEIEAPATAEYGRVIHVIGRVTEDEDEEFDTRRLELTSDRDGEPPGNRLEFPRQVTLQTGSLSTGEHRLTFTATDSGGLSASAATEVTVTNEPPDRPVIVQPTADETIVATAPVTLRGSAFDAEDWAASGELVDGDDLVWRLSAQGGPFEEIATGRWATAVLDEAGEAVLTLTATDSVGESTVSEPLALTVQPFSGNAPPQVSILAPDPSATLGLVAASVVAGAPVQFIGSAQDQETPLDELELRWRFEAIDGVGGEPLEPPPVPDPADVTGTFSATVAFPAVADGYYRVTFSADDGELATSRSVEILVLSQPIL